MKKWSIKYRTTFSYLVSLRSSARLRLASLLLIIDHWGCMLLSCCNPRRCDKGGMAEQEGGTMGSASPRPYPPPEPPCNPPFVGSTDSSIRNIGAYERAFLLVAHFVSRDASVVLPFPTNNTKIINLYKLENTPK